MRCLMSLDYSELIHEVRKPGRYGGNCLNFPTKLEGKIKFLLCFPDVFEIGISNLGLRILYHVVNRQPDLLADLAFAPWMDMEAYMRSRKICLYGLGTHLPAKQFDIVGFSLQHELHYTNVLTMLDLSGIPLGARERGEQDPIVIAGGPCAFNPEPMAKFIDAFVIGDGEAAIVEIGEMLKDAKSASKKRGEVLEELGSLKGIYVPQVVISKSGQMISRRTESLRDADFPIPPIVSVFPAVHDRLTLEIMRGCTHGCRFCSAGMVTRPVRVRSVESVVRLAEAGIDASGWEEISLISLSSSDYPGIGDLVKRLNMALGERRVSISLPSMRPGTFTEEMAELISTTKRTGLTFAPETGSDHLRRRINKMIDEDELLASVETAFRSGWDGIKLYFMIGLPGETYSDIDGLIKMVRSVEAICRFYGQRKHITVSISPFVPRPQTPFQWEPQQPPEEILARIRYIRKNLPGRRIKVKWRDPFMAHLEGLLARGDRLYADAILAAWRSGSRFESWSDRFDFNLWLCAFKSLGIDLERAFVRREIDEPLPWDHIDAGVTRSFLKAEARRADAGETTPDCRIGGCTDCGACEGEMLTEKPKAAESTIIKYVLRAKPQREELKMRLRVKYAKREEMLLASHLDIARAIQRALRRAKMPLCYSEGFSPHPRVAFGPPLPLGCLGEGEYFDVILNRVPPREWIEQVNSGLPKGLVVLEGGMVRLRSESLIDLINAATYAIEITCEPGEAAEQVASHLTKSLKGTEWVISLDVTRHTKGLKVTLAARLSRGGKSPEKRLDELLKTKGYCYRITRTGLYVEVDGKLTSVLRLASVEEQK